MSPVSQYESAIWSSLIVTVAASVYFFGKVFGAFAAGAPLGMTEIFRLGTAIVVILVAVEIAFQVALQSWCKGEPQTDERDALIAAKSTRNAYYVLVTGQFLFIGHLGIQAMLGVGPYLMMDVPTMIIFMIFALVLAEVIHLSSRIWYYRRGL